MGLIAHSIFALLACWRASAVGEQTAVVETPSLSEASESIQETDGSCSDAASKRSQKRARGLLQNQRMQIGQVATQTFTVVEIGGVSTGFCDGKQIGTQLAGAETEDDCADKCKKEKKCDYFSFATKRCRLFETCVALKGGCTWTSYKAGKSIQVSQCKKSCAKDRHPWEQKCTWSRCSACTFGCQQPAPVTRKRGYGHRPGEDFSQCNDTAALGLADSWYYTWTPTDSPQWRCHNNMERVGNEFVPQILNCNSADEIWDKIEFYSDRWKALGVKFLLGFNEPDGHIHPCEPSEAVTQWLTVQRIAKYFQPPLRLVSPAPTGKDFVKGNSKWLNEFFSLCEKRPACKPEDIEIIAWHDYEGDFDVREDNIQARVAGAAEQYKRPLWLTEFNVGCSKTSLCRDCKNTIYRGGKCNWPKNADDSISFEEHLFVMKKALPFFEQSEHIFRYTWFGARVVPNSFAGYSQLLPHDSDDQTLTVLGEYYRDLEG